MRSSDEIKKMILDKANADSRIRAVLLIGSRANSKVTPDAFQDFDIVFIVHEIDTFLADHSWTSIFGKKITWQLPDEMTFGKTGSNKIFPFHYLMLFKDGNRIDLSMFPAVKLTTDFKSDSLTVVWLDKDNLFVNIPPADDKDYLIKHPSENEFTDTCNEFWWVCTYVAKGLVRDEITYAKEMLEVPLRQMFMNMIEWHIGVHTNFSVAFGKGGKFMKKYMTANEYETILTTYPDYKSENIWASLFIMTEVFSKFAIHLANKLHFNYNLEEQNNIMNYLQQMRNDVK